MSFVARGLEVALDGLSIPLIKDCLAKLVTSFGHDAEVALHGLSAPSVGCMSGQRRSPWLGLSLPELAHCSKWRSPWLGCPLSAVCGGVVEVALSGCPRLA